MPLRCNVRARLPYCAFQAVRFAAPGCISSCRPSAFHQPAVLCADKPGVLLPFFAYEGIKAHFAGKVKPRISGNSTGGYIWESISRAATRAASLTSPPMIRASSSSRPSSSRGATCV